MLKSALLVGGGAPLSHGGQLEGALKLKGVSDLGKFLSGDSTHAVRLGHQRASQSVEGASDPGSDWIHQKLKRTKKTRWHSSTEVHTSLSRNRLQYQEGDSEIGGRHRARRAAGNLKGIGRLSTYL